MTYEKTLKRIAATCKEMKSHTKHPRYPDQVKADVLDLLSSGLSSSRISVATTLSDSVIRKWASQANDSAGVTTEQEDSVKSIPVVESPIGVFSNCQQPLITLKSGRFEITVFAQDQG